jgi:soluble lytic murein transglycosylase-like protein
VEISLKFGIVTLIGASALANAADLAILRNGNSIRHERRQVVGSVTRLYLSDSTSGYIEIPTSEIERFEVDTAPPPQAKPPVANAQPTVPPRVTAAPPVATMPQHTAPVLDRAALGQLVNGAGERNQIDPDFINSVIRVESGFNSRAVSKKGAQGLMQLMPQTASQLGVTNSFDPKANVEGGTKYLRELLEKYNYDVVKTLAAYNAGPQRVEQYHGVPPYYETRAYIARIIRDFNRKKLAQNPALAKKSPATKQTSPRKKTSATRPAPQGTERASR